MSPRAIPKLFACLMALGQIFEPARAQTYNVLQECTNQSPDIDDIHACLDNYLDIMDANIDDVSTFLNRTLEGPSLAGFKRSQQAFVQYRRQNCLWYLEFSSPRSEAEQIAKNCLATMSQQRLSELQRLMAADKTNESTNTLRGFYVYGASSNSFQLCGRDARYWVEGDNPTLNQIQQLYLNAATADLQIMYAVVQGELDDNTPTVEGHQGVLRLAAVDEIRVPNESDCRLPSGQAAAFSALASTSITPVEPAVAAPEPVVAEEQEEPQQQLVAYFGAWIADCIENDGNRRCNLQVDMQADGSANEGEMPTLSVARKTRQRTTIEVRFPDREIDTPQRIRWGVDAYVFGDILGSEIRVDEAATRQLVNERRFINEDLMPLMVGGGKLTLDVLASVDDRTGEKFSATLRGLTRALAFADEFVSDGS